MHARDRSKCLETHVRPWPRYCKIRGGSERAAPSARAARAHRSPEDALAMDTLNRRHVAASLAATLALGLALLTGCSSSNPVAPIPLPPLSAVVLTPSDTTLKVGQSAAFSAVALDTDTVAVANARFGWSSSDPGVFTVSSAGVVTARGEGSALLIAAAGGKSDTASIEVTPVTRGWYAQASGVANKLNGVFFRPGGRLGWAVGATGAIRATRDAGVTWTQQTGTASSLNAVWFTSDAEGWAVGDNGTLLHTTNGGTNWTTRAVAGGAHLYDVWFATPDTGWAVGANGAVVRTFDHGTTWTQTNPTTFALRGVSFFGTRYGWAVGDNGVIVSTTDRGLSWGVVTTVTALNLRAVWRTSLLRANAVGAAGAAPRTDDDGLGAPQWTLVNPGAAYAMEGVCFVDASKGWAVGLNGTGFVLATIDGGLGWTPQTISAGNRLNDVFFVDETRGWAVGDNGQIFHTATGGQP